MMNKPAHGHYVNLTMVKHNTPEVRAQLYEMLPEMTGLLCRYNWNQLEIGPRRYDFTPVLNDLDWCAQRGLRWVAMLQDKSFANQPSSVPAYLDRFTAPNRNGGITAVRFAPEILEPFCKLWERLSRHSQHPAWEGLMTQESAIGLDKSVLDYYGYTPERYVESYRTLFSRTEGRIFWQANFIYPHNEELIPTLMDAVAGTGVHVGGPDCLPKNKALLERAYPEWRKYDENFVAMMFDSYSVEGMSIEQVMRYGLDDLKAKWMFWSYVDNFAEQARLIKQEAR